MKQVILGKEDEDYILKLITNNKWLYKSGDFTSVKDLYTISQSVDFTNNLPLLFKFDTALTKLTKEHADFIATTNHNVIIFTDDMKLIPVGVKAVCEVSQYPTTHPCIKILQKLGIDCSYEDVESIPLGQLIKYLNVNWDKFESKEDVFKILLEVNKKLYKVGDDWLKLYLIYGFPTQKRKTFFRFPVVNKKGIKEGIIEKIGKYYGMSSKEVMKSWWLIRRLLNSDDAEKFGLDDEELKLLGIKKVKKEIKEEVVEKKKYRGLLE